jgi:hypothetical protein
MQAEQSYYHAKCSTESLPAGMRDSLSYVFDPSVSDSTASITYWFPWMHISAERNTVFSKTGMRISE